MCLAVFCPRDFLSAAARAYLPDIKLINDERMNDNKLSTDINRNSSSSVQELYGSLS